jgi:hypothetical protein
MHSILSKRVQCLVALLPCFHATASVAQVDVSDHFGGCVLSLVLVIGWQA